MAIPRVLDGQHSPGMCITSAGGPGSAVQAGGMLSTGHQGDPPTEGTRSLPQRRRVVGLGKRCGEAQGALQHPGEGCRGWGAWAMSGRCLLGERGAVDLLRSVRKCVTFVSKAGEMIMYKHQYKNLLKSGNLTPCSLKKKFLATCITLCG